MKRTLKDAELELIGVRRDLSDTRFKNGQYIVAGAEMEKQHKELQVQLAEYHELYALLKQSLKQAHEDIAALKLVNSKQVRFGQ